MNLCFDEPSPAEMLYPSSAHGNCSDHGWCCPSHTLPPASTSTYLITHSTNLGHSYPRGKYIINFHPGQLPDDSSWLLTVAAKSRGGGKGQQGRPGGRTGATPIYRSCSSPGAPSHLHQKQQLCATSYFVEEKV